MNKKPLSKITISEIVADCGVNRKTFYYHFEDMNALLKWTFEQEAIEVVKNFDLITENEDAFRFVMDYIEQNDLILNNLCHSMGQNELKRFFFNDFYEIVHSIVDKIETIEHLSVPDDYKNFVCLFYTEAIAGVLLDWITTEKPRDREQTIQYISTTLQVSISACMKNYESTKEQDFEPKVSPP